jgi:biopolymer transport protein ExbD
MPGIPCGDSTNNELTDWMASVVRSYAGESLDNLNLLVKGDNAAKYPAFKNIKAAFKKNEIFKFKIVTNPEGIPSDSELALNPPDAKK